MGQKICISDIFKLLELLEWEIVTESWYDEEGIEGTRLISPNQNEYTIYGWEDDCNFDDIIKAVEQEVKSK
ncbi:hypothetical protein [Wukongibacter sp. M2B1]|uniref:hypothetical protein n=1 Tax=Wukongibacter sp. M2B1 TaxID=3088895 RepID=UPI003D7B540B